MRHLTEPWAKTSAAGETRSVFEHCLDVAVTVHTILGRDIGRRRLNTSFGKELTETHLARLTVLAGLHDFGKTLKGFQDKLDCQPGNSSGHVSEALAVLKAVHKTREAIGIDILRCWFNEPTDAVYVALPSRRTS